jgi:hypothetical protein
MKTFLTLALLFISGITFARHWTVSNNPDQPAQYTSINDAHAAASNGDTILVAGFSTIYAPARISKKIYLIGNAALSSPAYQRTLCASILFDSLSSTQNASGSSLIGMTCFAVTVKLGVKNIRVERCSIGDITLGESENQIITFNGKYSRDILIKNCYYINIYILNTSFNYNPAPGLKVQNCISSGLLSEVTSAAFSNNIFIYSLENSVIKNTSFVNNIFYKDRLPNSQSTVQASGCTFFNNISAGTSGGHRLPYVNCTGSGNLSNVSPRWISQFSIDEGVIFFYEFLINDNYGLQATSTLLNAGTDGTDIGITGGLSSNRWSNSPLPNMPLRQAPTPVVTELKINNGQYYTTTNTFQVQLKAKKRD